MRNRATVAALLAVMALAVGAWAQEGHPLAGTWHGSWTAGGKQMPVVLYMQWESRRISGMINPGPDAVHLSVATLDPSDWSVHLEAEGKDASGKAVPIEIDGKIDEIGSYNRTLSGTWMEGAQKGEFKLTRD